MDKQRAEQILEIEPPYTYAELRSAWKERCQEYHPDRSAATGMDTEAANDVLRDINEAFQYLSKMMNSETSSSASESGGTTAATYAVAVQMMENAATSQEWATAEAVLRSIAGFQDAEALADMCAFSAQVAAKAEARRDATDSPQRTENWVRNGESAQTQDSMQRKERVIDGWDTARITKAAQDKTTDEAILHEIYELREKIDSRILDEEPPSPRGTTSSGPKYCEDYLILNPNLPTDILLKLLEPERDTVVGRIRYDSIKRNAFRDAHIPYEIMKEIALSNDADKRRMLATNKHLPLELQKMLSEDQSPEVRRALASNREISQNVMRLLAKDSSVDVRRSLADNFSLNNEIMELLVVDQDQEVRCRLVTHASPEILRKLASDSSFKVRHHAKKKAKFRRSVASTKEQKEKWKL